MIRSMMAALAVLGLASSAMAQTTVKVHVVKSGQFYHRPECLVVEEQRPLDLDEAIKNSFVPCPECAPARYVDKALKDDGMSPYLRQKLALRVAGNVYNGEVPGRQKTLKEKAADEKNPKPKESAAPVPVVGPPGGVAAAPFGTVPALKAAASAGTPPRESAATGTVPGTGGLLQAAQFAPTPMQNAMTYYGQPIPQPQGSSGGGTTPSQ